MAKHYKRKTTQPPENDYKKDLAGLALIALSLIGLAGIFTSSVGTVGMLIKQGMQILAGKGYIAFLLILALAGIKLMRREKWQINSRLWGLVIFFGSLQIFLHRNVPLAESFSTGLQGGGGGLSGAALGYVFMYSFGTVGTYIILGILVMAGAALCSGGTLKDLLVKSWLKIKAAALRVWNLTFNFLFVEEDDDDQANRKKNKLGSQAKTGLTGTALLPAEEPVLPIIEVARTAAVTAVQPAESSVESSLEGDMAGDAIKSADTHKENLPNGKEYHMPPLALLNLPQSSGENTAGRDITGRINKLEQILESFNIKAKVVNVSVGPAITRYELQPPPGIKVSKIVSLSDDIALGMATTGVRIEAPIPGKAAVGIEVPNIEVDMVTLRELLETREFTGSASRLTVAFGKDIAGTPILADLAKMPHLLIAGATGSGKSVCVNTLICSILFKAAPDEVKFLMVDPKMVELANYNDIPHLVSPVVTDAKKAAGALRWAVREMESRYDRFAAAGVRDITRYNALFGEFELEPGQTPMPYIVLIIDELADLMMVAPADVEDSICRLAQMARAAGIHLVVATQRPSVDVITGLIKANIPSRVSFAVSSQIDSRTILDMGGAEKLLGKGDMLFFPVGAAKPVRVQGAFLSDKEVENLVDFLKDQARPDYNDEVLQEHPGNETVETEDSDELLPQAARIFIESGTASISMLQRRLHVGYSRAARLVDIMERRGIVGGFEGSKPRAVLMTLEQYRHVFESKPDEAAENRTAS
ncbi:MAG: cell division protein FtsK [Peptococcaceae bacterium BRH_c8a]|nr:MAG: cell division protein FtsK [Peptococcaceae bacterium BRH_c8a]